LISEKLIKFGKNILNLGDDATAERTIDELRRWYKSVGAPITLKELGFTQEDVQKVTQIASKHAPLGKVKRLDIHDIESIYRIAYEF